MPREDLHIQADRLARQARWIFPAYWVFSAASVCVSFALLVWVLCLALKA